MFSRRPIPSASALAVFMAIVVTAVSVSSQPRRPGGSAGNARFVEIENIEGFSGFFNLSQGTVRIVSLMSASCPECRSGFNEIKRIMDTTPTRRLRTYIVFMPVDEHDTRSIAMTLLANLNDRRASYFWDPMFAVGSVFNSITGSDEPVRDTHFLFDTDAVIRETPTTPILWMHQHKHGDNPVMNGDVLEKRVHELLSRIENKQRALRKAPARAREQ